MGENDLISRKALLHVLEHGDLPAHFDGAETVAWMIRQIIEFAPAVDAAPTWISVEDALPERGEVIVCCPDPDRPVQSAWYDGDRWLNHYGRSIGLPVTHWMPLPPAPGEAEHEHGM